LNFIACYIFSRLGADVFDEQERSRDNRYFLLYEAMRYSFCNAKGKCGISQRLIFSRAWEWGERGNSSCIPQGNERIPRGNACAAAWISRTLMQMRINRKQGSDYGLAVTFRK
jgi:hypothetical protein